AAPVGLAEPLLVLDEVAEGVADRPRPADQLKGAALPAQALQAAGVVLRQGVVVPADGPADLGAVAVDAAGGVVRGRDAAGGPLLEAAQLPEPGGDGAGAGPGLALQLHQVQLRDAARGPEVGRQPNFGERVPVEVERQALDRPGREVPAGDDAVGGDATQGLGHGWLLLAGERSLLPVV